MFRETRFILATGTGTMPAFSLLLVFVSLCGTLGVSDLSKEAYVVSKRTLASSNGANDASFWVTYFGQTGKTALCVSRN